MADERWLWDQPKTWHGINRALLDIGVLLNYLNEQPDSRLLSYFKATQDRIDEGAPRNTVPPCDSYAEFLDRLAAVAEAFQTGRAPPPQPPPPPVGAAAGSAIAFVDWSRDFLAAVAAPATASSVRLTREYAVYRSHRRWRWVARLFGRAPAPAEPPSGNPPTIPVLPPDPDAPIHQRFARHLAVSTRMFEL